MKKNHIIVTGGAGFVGSSLIENLLKFKKYKIISIDNYSSGNIKNHIKHKNVKYLKCDTKNIETKLFNIKNKIITVFHFGEFARIYQSFLNMNECIDSNTVGSNAIFNFPDEPLILKFLTLSTKSGCRSLSSVIFKNVRLTSKFETTFFA